MTKKTGTPYTETDRFAEMIRVAAIGEGIHPGIHNDTYRAFDALSYSDLKQWVTGRAVKPTPAMAIGTAVHALLLDPEHAAEEFVTAPENVDRRTKHGRDLYDEWAMEHPTKIVLLPRQREEVKHLVNAVKGNPLAMKIIEAEGNNEVSVVTKMPGHKLLSKCRLDMERKNSIWDLKTTGKASQAEFEESICDFAYDGQSAYYADQYANVCGQFKQFGWIVVSKRSLQCWISIPDPRHYAAGRRWWQDNLTLKERCDG